MEKFQYAHIQSILRHINFDPWWTWQIYIVYSHSMNIEKEFIMEIVDRGIFRFE